MIEMRRREIAEEIIGNMVWQGNSKPAAVTSALTASLERKSGFLRKNNYPEFLNVVNVFDILVVMLV